MFSNPKKFFKKNIVLIGIVVLLIIIIAIYFLYANYKEGFYSVDENTVLTKAKLIPLSTVDNWYNNLTDPNDKKIVEPVVELYKLFVANYDAVFALSQQIVDMLKNFKSETGKYFVPMPQPVNPNNVNHAAEDAANMEVYYKLIKESEQNLKNEWFPKIDQGVIKVLTNAIKWLPTAKRLYDNYVSTNYYGLRDTPPILNADGSSTDKGGKKITELAVSFTNALYEDDQLSIIYGPAFAKSNPTPPVKMPISEEQMLDIFMNSPELGMYAFTIPFQQYIATVSVPFVIIMEYLSLNWNDSMRTGDLSGAIQKNVLTNTIVQLIEQLNNLLETDITNQAIIGQLTAKLSTALANDALDYAKITALQDEVKNLKTQQNSVLNVGTNIMPAWTPTPTTTAPSVPKDAMTSVSPAPWIPNLTSIPNSIPKYTPKVNPPAPVSKPGKKGGW